jgi:DNA-binding CsgD family transcriptional regulator
MSATAPFHHPGRVPGVWSEDEVRDLLRISLGDQRFVGDASQSRQQMITGLLGRGMPGRWLWGLLRTTDPGQDPDFLHRESFGLTAGELTAYWQAFAQKAVSSVFSGLVWQANLARVPLTIRPERQFLRFPGDGALALWRKAGVSWSVLSLHPQGGNRVSVFALHRPPGARPFSDFDVCRIETLLSEVPVLHRPPIASPLPGDVVLYPRQREILRLLLDGCSRKAIAAELGITPNTVAGYVREIYRAFRVCSHAMLIKRLNGSSVVHALQP